MTVSAYPALCDKLVAVFQAANLGTVFDGPGASDTAAKQVIFVGIEADDALVGPGSGGNGQVSWATMGTNHSRDEIVTVHCLMRARSGDQTPSARRNEVFALFGSAVNAITADPSLGRPGGVLYLQGYSYDYGAVADFDGSAAEITASFVFRARI